ncbi:MAG TPA: non-homologous end-joining DNA ligase [Rhodanobacteraceae bacterium]|nr:non-homologous end-joining DNA ligase [Rhodanobacteraceae bacterium]
MQRSMKAQVKSAKHEAERPAKRSADRREAVHPAADVRITHPERVVFPDTTITKGDVAAYYAAIMDWLLPELEDRPLSIIRCPDGAGATCFFQKHHADKLGAHVGSILLKEKKGSDRYLHVSDPRGVLELVQMNTIEFHPWGSRIDEPEKPDRLVFDLDPAPGIGWSDLVAAAKDVRARVRAHGLESFPRLTGGKGVHVVAPIRRGPLWEEAKAFCERIANEMADARPDRYLANASKAAREGRIFIDWLRNARGATSVASFSLRARAGAPVAMPVRWEELARLGGANAFDLAGALKRVKAMRRHPWGDFAKTKQTLARGRR